VAYPPYMTAALSGATVRQLAHWRRETSSGAVLIPEVSPSKPILYSFRDVVALRTCVYLRKEASLQKIRRAIGNLRSLGELDHLSKYTLVSENESIVLVESDSATDLVKQPGQTVMAEMSNVLRPFLNKNEVEVPALLRPREHIAVDPEVRSGHPVITGTRVPYENVAGLVADGVPADSIGDYYPSVNEAAAVDALSFAKYVDSWRSRDWRRNSVA
jgi:uncharacterized protein (DUF433 family)